MSFLFKSKKNQDRSLSSRDGNSNNQGTIHQAAGRLPPAEKGAHRGTPTGSVNSIENNSLHQSPEQHHGRRGGSIDQTQSMQQPQPGSDLALRNGAVPTQNPNASLYPWSQRRLSYTSSHPSPFPRYGAAVNSASSKEGDIYMMGGLINSSTVKGDLWMIEAGGNMACYPLATTAEGPGPRVGHASLLVGNAFIVYGGDTKIDDSDVLDETLYLLNTSTRHWSRALPAGPRPSGRYGHSLNILGSKIYIFGGQVEGYFMNDLAAFDLNQLQMANNRWEILLKSESSPKLPAARTNHTVVTYNDCMYLFGGTNGFQWFNDVWCYDPATNRWTQLDCIGYIPSPREGHAAAIVDDVMYVFGGRTEEGTDLGDLAAFRISLRRWYTFQNMGPSPSPRSGHSMTTVGKSIVVLGGEPSSTTTAINDLGILYVLDTTKIRYPIDAQQPGARGQQGVRRPSNEIANKAQSNVRESPSLQEPRRLVSSPPPNAMSTTSPNGAAANPNGPHAPSTVEPPQAANSTEIRGNAGALGAVGAVAAGGAIAAGAAAVAGNANRGAPPPSGPPPTGPTPPKPGDPPAMDRARGASTERSITSESPNVGVGSSSSRDLAVESEGPGPTINGLRTPTQSSNTSTPRAEPISTEKSRHSRPSPSQASIDGASSDLVAKSGLAIRPASPPPPSRQVSNPMSRRSSGRNSQTVALLKELDTARNRNAWYASELELARKAGFSPNTSSSPALDVKTTQTFDDEDRPLIEALLTMRTELANVQSAVDKQAVIAARQIAEAEKQRDAAIQEAVYAKAKLAANTGGSASSTPQLDTDRDDVGRSDDMSRKLATTLTSQKDLQTKVDSMKRDLEAEKRARQLADETSTAAEKRMAHLETYKQQTSAELEKLKSELHLAQREAREHSVSATDAVSALALLKVEKEDYATKYNDAISGSRGHEETFGSLRAAIQASEDAKSHLETKLGDERIQREELESKYNQLKQEHDARSNELTSSQQKLRDAEEMAEKHAHEAKMHRHAVLAGLDKINMKDNSARSIGADTERSTALQTQVTSANALVKKYQQELDVAADKLRSAEERIAGLEQYQEQSSREGVSIRRQLQAAMRETQSLHAAHGETKNQLAAQQLETNAMMVQHTALKDILSERGISPTATGRTRGLGGSPRTISPEQTRLRELESQLAGANAAHEESKQAFAVQSQESESAYREKLSQLESDYQSAVHYVKGTEKMLKQLKEQLSRYKTDNARLKSEVEQLEEQTQGSGGNASRSIGGAPANWEAERDSLNQKIEDLQEEIVTSGMQMEDKLNSVKAELADSKRQHEHVSRSSEEATKKFDAQRKDLDQLRSENSLLEQRATDAEQRVALLLDQVEHSVDSYRRRSRTAPPAETESTNGADTTAPQGHTRTESSEAGSTYGGNSLDARNSAALDNLASELETLRTHWEATNKNYRLSTNFDFDPPADGKKSEHGNASGLSESLADWRKKLDADEHGDKTKQ